MTCEFGKICRRMHALREVQQSNGFEPEEYSLTELKVDICDHPNDEARVGVCPAFDEFKANGRSTQWAK